MTIIATIRQTGNNSFEVDTDATVANCFFFGMGKTKTDAKSDFMASVHDMQRFVSVTRHPQRRKAANIKVNFVECV